MPSWSIRNEPSGTKTHSFLEAIHTEKLVSLSEDYDNWVVVKPFGLKGMEKEDAYNIRRPVGSQIFFAGEHTTFPEEQFGRLNG